VVTQAERRTNTRSAIVQAAFAEYKARGTADVALDVIAERAGVTKGSIHYHFKNRVGLIRAVAVWVFQKMEEDIALAPAASKKTKNRDSPAISYVRMLLNAQATPTGRVLYTVGDELARAGKLQEVDPYVYLCRKLQSMEIEGSVSVIAAAITQLGRQLAYELAPKSDIEDMVTALSAGGRLS
jgi:AcrR family transcriptional regulator